MLKTGTLLACPFDSGHAAAASLPTLLLSGPYWENCGATADTIGEGRHNV